MQTLNAATTALFAILLRKMEDAPRKTFKTFGGIDLILAKMAPSIQADAGVAAAYRLGQYAASGDRFPAPEMEFLVTDNRRNENDIENLRIVACSFQHYQKNLVQRSIFIEGNVARLEDPLLQQRQTRVAHFWFSRLAERDYFR